MKLPRENKYKTLNPVHGLEGSHHSHQLNIVIIYMVNDLAGLQIVCQRRGLFVYCK